VDERVADEDVIDQLQATVEHAAEATILGQDARCEVPQPLPVAGIVEVEAARVDLRAGRAEQDLRGGGQRLVVEIAALLPLAVVPSHVVHPGLLGG
jgi:hypothetical protein